MENEILTPGQKAVIDGYLQRYEPTETFEEDSCTILETSAIIDEISNMCDFDRNTLADYLASIGYRFHIVSDLDSILVGLSG